MTIDREITDWRRGEPQPRGRIGGSIVWLTSVRTDVNYTNRQFVKHKMVYTCTMAVMVRLYAQ
jgi:hypothetical protein